MTSQELRQKFLDFFKNKGHAVLASASLIPENDPTTLFISAGMHPLVPYLMGEAHPQGKRLASVQNVSGQETLTKSAMVIITLFLKCSATGLWATILKKKRLLGVMNF